MHSVPRIIFGATGATFCCEQKKKKTFSLHSRVVTKFSNAACCVDIFRCFSSGHVRPSFARSECGNDVIVSNMVMSEDLDFRRRRSLCFDFKFKTFSFFISFRLWFWFIYIPHSRTGTSTAVAVAVEAQSQSSFATRTESHFGISMQCLKQFTLLRAAAHYHSLHT